MEFHLEILSAHSHWVWKEMAFSYQLLMIEGTVSIDMIWRMRGEGMPHVYNGDIIILEVFQRRVRTRGGLRVRVVRKGSIDRYAMDGPGGIDFMVEFCVLEG